MAYISECVAYRDLEGNVQMAEDGILYLHLQLNKDVDLAITLNPVQAYRLGEKLYQAANDVTVDEMKGQELYGNAEILLEKEAAETTAASAPLSLAQKIA